MVKRVKNCSPLSQLLFSRKTLKTFFLSYQLLENRKMFIQLTCFGNILLRSRVRVSTISNLIILWRETVSLKFELFFIKVFGRIYFDLGWRNLQSSVASFFDDFGSHQYFFYGRAFFRPQHIQILGDLFITLRKIVFTTCMSQMVFSCIARLDFAQYYSIHVNYVKQGT